MSVEYSNTCAWLDLLYGKCHADDGQIVIVASTRNRLVGIHRVGSGKALVEAAADMHTHPGCYAKINLMDAEAMRRRAQKRGKYVVGNRDEVKTIVSLHLDIDAGKSSKYVTRNHALWALEQCSPPPTLVINSGGTESGFHAYWCLAEPHRIADDADRRRIQKIANAHRSRVAEFFGGKIDSTANIDRVLRCVGVPRTDGHRVFMQDYYPERLYEIADFD